MMHPTARQKIDAPTARDILGAVARGWSHGANREKAPDPDLAIAIAAEVSALLDGTHNAEPASWDQAWGHHCPKSTATVLLPLTKACTNCGATADGKPAARGPVTPALLEGMESVPCALRDGWLYIPHVDGKWVTAAHLQPFSLAIIKHWRIG